MAGQGKSIEAGRHRRRDMVWRVWIVAALLCWTCVLGPKLALATASSSTAGVEPAPRLSARVGNDAFLTSTVDPSPRQLEMPVIDDDGAVHLGWGSQLAILGTYGILYGIATHVGMRHLSDGHFKVVRLESAYLYDFVGHAFLVREMGGLASTAQRTAGVPAGQARHDGVWLGAFGSEIYMEILNGFIPGIRFDPLDPVANFAGAMMATKGQDLAARHEWIARMSLQFGYKDWGRAFEPSHDDATLGAIWHDHTNGRFGFGYDIGPFKRPWVTVFASYEITSLQREDLKNRFGMGIELQPFNWFDPWIRKLPGGSLFLEGYDWLNQRILMPVLYIQLFHVDNGPFSDRPPFQE